MLFTSYAFIGFMFLVFFLYYLVPKRGQWMLLLGASYVFYALCDISYLIYIIVTTISTYLISIQLTKIQHKQSDYLKEHKKLMTKEKRKAYKASMKSKQFRWLIVCLLLNFGILAVLKYTNFAIANVNSIIHMTGSDTTISFVNLVLPLGISFYTFQTMGYIIDVYRSTVEAETNPFKLALFVSFFPQLIQGPISRFHDLSNTLFEEHPFDGRQVSFGLQRILWGYFKKMVIADRILVAVNLIIQSPETYQGSYVLIGMVFYGFELYADFTGGIDITIGIAQVMGIRVTENFARPYFSKNIAEYWRRWHITMGTWFKDYIFYPISVCQPMLKLSKKTRQRCGDIIGKRIAVYIATFVAWFATGIWHGASWNFIMWGIMNCVVILISQECEPLYRRFHNRFPYGNTSWYRLFQILRTFFLMSSLRLFDCYRDVKTAFLMFFDLFIHFDIRVFFNGSLMELGLSTSDYVVLLIGFLVLLTVSLLQRRGSVRECLHHKPVWIRYGVIYLLFLSVIIFGAYGMGYDASQFIYNQF